MIQTLALSSEPKTGFSGRLAPKKLGAGTLGILFAQNDGDAERSCWPEAGRLRASG
jgi:hypothetical protein